MYYKKNISVIYTIGIILENQKKEVYNSGPMRSYPVKENPIGSAFSEILPYKHTNIL